MNKKRIISLLIATMTITELLPVSNAMAYDTGKLSSYSPKVVSYDDRVASGVPILGWVTSNLNIHKGTGMVIVGKGTANIDVHLEGVTGLGEDLYACMDRESLSKLTGLNLTFSEYMSLAKALDESKYKDLTYMDNGDIVKAFNLTLDKSDKKKAENIVFRDAIVAYIIKNQDKLKTKEKASIINDIKKLYGITDNNGDYKVDDTKIVTKLITGENALVEGKTYKDMKSLAKYLDSLVGKDLEAKEDETNIEQIEKEFDVDYNKLGGYDKAVHAINILTIDGINVDGDKKQKLNKSIDDYIKYIQKYFDEVENEDEMVIKNPSTEREKTINAVLRYAYKNLKDTEFRAVMALFYGTGSIYELGGSKAIALTSLPSGWEEKLQVSGNDTSNEEFAKQAVDEGKQLLDSNKSLTDVTDQRYVTLYQRMKYAKYAMQVYGGVDGGAIETLCKSSSEITTRTYTPPLIRNPKVQDFESYVYLNNCLTDIDTMANVIIPTLGNVTSSVDVRSSKAQLALLELQSIYNSLSVLVDDASGIEVENEDSRKDLKYLWEEKKVPLDNGTQTEMTLSELYTKLKGLNIDFPDLKSFNADDSERPLRNFFNLKESDLCSELKMGIALSATYIPMKTNIYDPITYKSINDDDDFFKFHARYGYNRKALYMDTNTSSVSTLYNTGNTGNRKLCTLADLLDCEKEVTLYIDDNFYNVNKLEQYRAEGIQRMDNVDSKSDTENDDKSTIGKLWSKVTEAFDMNILDVTKTAENITYPNRLVGCHSYSETKEIKYTPNELDDAILDGNQIDAYINSEDDYDFNYNVMRAFAFTSSVYRDIDLFNFIKDKGISPVFMSSKDFAKNKEYEDYWTDTYLNYVLLKNIQDNENVNYTSNIDMDKPIYMDVYGNIVTESGVVAIPASTNATLSKSYTPFTAGFLSTYGKKFFIPGDIKFISDSNLAAAMQLNEEKNRWEFQAKSINGKVDYNELSTADEEAMETITSKYISELSTSDGKSTSSRFNFDVYVPNVFMEVMRGAPLESIDKEYEGLNRGGRVTKNAIKQAMRLDTFKSSLESKVGESSFAVPNISFISNIEYVIMFIYRLVLILITALVIIQLVHLGTRGSWGIKGIVGSMIVSALTIGAIWLIPYVYNTSYYQTNKALLQKESTLVNMLNLERKEAGLEVGMTSTKEVTNSSKFYIKMKDIDMPIWKVCYNVVTANLDTSLKDVYEEYARDDIAFGENQFEFINGSLFISTDNLFDSTTVTFNPNYATLYSVATEKTPASFYTPYYAFLQEMAVKVNTYNEVNNIKQYTTQTYAGGKIKSLGLIKAYFTSDDFIGDDNYDFLNLMDIYGKNEGNINQSMFSEEDLSYIRKSDWCDTDLKAEQVAERVEKMDKRAKRFVANNKELIGRISDETFLKCMALDLANYHNNIFNTGSADCYEIYNLSKDDLTKISIADRSTVIKDSPLSFSRFICNNGGEIAIYASAILVAVNFLENVLVPIILFIIFAVIIGSLTITKIITREWNTGFKGYIILTALLCIVNVLYALSIKFLVAFPLLHWSPTVAIIIQIFIKLILIGVYMYLMILTLMNYKDLGELKYRQRALSVIGKTGSSVTGFSGRALKALAGLIGGLGKAGYRTARGEGRIIKERRRSVNRIINEKDFAEDNIGPSNYRRVNKFETYNKNKQYVGNKVKDKKQDSIKKDKPRNNKHKGIDD